MNHLKLDGFLNYLYNQAQKEREKNAPKTKEEFYSSLPERRIALKSILGIDKLESFNFEPKYNFIGLEKHNGYDLEKFTIEILPELVVPVYALIPTSNTTKLSVLYCHGHGEGGCLDCLVEKNPPAYHKNIPIVMARRGYKVFMFEPAGFGSFRLEDYEYDGQNGCYPLTTILSLYGITTVGLRVYQAICLAKIMKKHFNISRFVSSGISGGGMVSAFYSAIQDEPIANIITGYANLFKTSIMAMRHCMDNFIPNILNFGENPDIIAMGAPKKLFISSGTKDPIFPIEGTINAFNYVKNIYKMLGIGEDIESDFFEGGHEYNFAFIDWLDKL